MSKEMVLRRILSNGNDRQTDRPAQTLSLRRLEERLGQFLSLSVPSLSLFFSLRLDVCVSDLFQNLASCILFSKQYKYMFLFHCVEIGSIEEKLLVKIHLHDSHIIGGY